MDVSISLIDLRPSLDNNNVDLSIMLQIFALAIAIAPCLVSAALFPPDTLVKMIDAKGFKKAMKANVGPIGLSLTQGIMMLSIYSGNKYGGFRCTLVWCTSLS